MDLLYQSGLKEIHGKKVMVLLIGYDGALEYERDLKAYVEKANLTSQVILVAKTSQPLAYAATADVHTSVSSHESFPLNSLEVMCLGESMWSAALQVCLAATRRAIADGGICAQGYR